MMESQRKEDRFRYVSSSRTRFIASPFRRRNMLKERKMAIFRGQVAPYAE